MEKIKQNYKILNVNKIFKLIDSMPMSKQTTPKNLSLYSDYNPKTTIGGLGFKNKEKAIFTIQTIKNKPMKYQLGVVNTMMSKQKIIK